MPVIIPSHAPNLQVPGPTYDPKQQNLLVNQLKLYFIQVDNNNQQLILQDKSLNVYQWLNTGM